MRPYRNPLTVGCLLGLLLGALLPAAPGKANVIGIEHYMGRPDLAYSGDLSIQGQAGTIRGQVYRAPDRQRTDVTVNGVPLTALADLSTGEGTLWSPVYRAYATTPLTAPGVQDWVPQLQHHTQVQIVPAAADSGLEAINGVMAKRHSLSGVSPAGTPYQGQLWTSPEGAIVRIVVRIGTQSAPVVYNLTNLKIEPQKPSLFAVPAGLQRRPWSDAVALIGG